MRTARYPSAGHTAPQTRQNATDGYREAIWLPGPHRASQSLRREPRHA
jgi:hypothetical protein